MRSPSSFLLPRIAMLAMCLLAVASASAAGPADFNYPASAQEGQKGYFAIADEGQARCVIVREVRSRASADLLKTYLELATGASFQVIDSGKPIPAGLGTIHVGETVVSKKVDLAIPDLHYGADVIANLNGYLVKTLDAKTLIIRGVNERATTLGVIGFLKRYAGVRHYWAGNPRDIGDVVPSQRTLTLPELTWRDWPYFVSRTMSGLGEFGPPPTEPGRKTSSVDFFRLNYTIPSNESYYRWLRADPHGKTHPEYFPLFEGQRFIPGTTQVGKANVVQQGWQPCVSNPELPRLIADQLIAYFDQNPSAIAINLAVNDGNGDCQCEKCAALDAPGADVSTRVGLCDRYIKFDNAVCELVAQKYPAKIIAFIAYGSMRMPPQTVKLHPMLLPVITMGGSANAFAEWDAWMKTGARRMGLYLYHDDQAFFILPKLDFHQSAKRIRYIVESGTARHFYQEMYPFWPLDGMVPYIENELLWDPRRDVDAILEEYYTSFFGPAAKAMKQFYGVLESAYERWLEKEGLPHPYGKDRGSLMGGRSFDQYKVLNPAEADQAAAHLKEASAAAQGDERVTARLGVVRSLFEFAALGARQYALMTTLTEAPMRIETDAEQMVAAARKLVALAHEQGQYKQAVMKQPPASHYAVFGSRSPQAFYDDIDPEKVNPQVALSISRSFARAAAALREKLGPEKAAAWWEAQARDEKDPLMRDVLAIARSRSWQAELTNLVKDASFESRDTAGVNTWHRNGTPFHVSLVNGEGHTGQHSVLASNCGKAVVSETASGLSGGRFHLAVWLKHNESAAGYQLQVTPTGSAGKAMQTIIEVPEDPGKWQKMELDYAPPADTRAISVQVVVNGQSPDAKLWIDDFFIGRYAD